MGGGSSIGAVHSSHPDSGSTSRETGTPVGLCRASKLYRSVEGLGVKAGQRRYSISCWVTCILKQWRVWKCTKKSASCQKNKKPISLNYLLKITIYSMCSIQGKSYKIVPITNLTKMSTWTKSYTKGKIKIILVINTRKKHYSLWWAGFTVVYGLVVYVCRFYVQSLDRLMYNYLFVGPEG
jgi:hypothetical protein